MRIDDVVFRFTEHGEWPPDGSWRDGKMYGTLEIGWRGDFVSMDYWFPNGAAPALHGYTTGNPVIGAVTCAMIDFNAYANADDMWEFFDDFGIEPSRESELAWKQMGYFHDDLISTFGDDTDVLEDLVRFGYWLDEESGSWANVHDAIDEWRKQNG